MFDSTIRVTTTEERLQEEGEHLERVLVNNGYPLTLINKSSQPTTSDECTVEADGEGGDKQPVVCIPHVAGLSEDIRRVRRWLRIKTIFKTGSTLWSYLMSVKDRVLNSMKSSMVNSFPGSCGKYTLERQ